MILLECLEEIESARLGKERLIALQKYDSSDLQSYLNWALGPSITFGVKDIPPPQEGLPVLATEEWFPALVKTLFIPLSRRELTGHDAKRAIAAFLGRCDETAQKWTRRALQQDLRIGVGAKDVNNALGENTIYTFNVPLALDYKKCKPKDLLGYWCVEAKLDGARCTAIIPDTGEITLLSRTGKVWKNFTSIKRALEASRPNLGLKPGEALYLDGEVVSYVDGRIDFQQTQASMMRKDGVEVGELKYIVFDACMEKEWKTPVQRYSTRHEFATTTVKKINNNKVTLVPMLVDSITFEDFEDADAYLTRQCQKAVEDGYEGLILRRLDQPVENKRGKLLLKVKLFQDAEFEIIGSFEGTGKLAGVLGGIVCKTEAGAVFEAGSGFNDAIRGKLWLNKDGLVGQKATIKFFEYTNAGVPRLPIFKSIRHGNDLP
jgi:ATP-dependent DNA ligase